MRVAIAGAGNVGRSIAQELIAADHQVMLIERSRASFEPHAMEQAEWVLADACELSLLLQPEPTSGTSDRAAASTTPSIRFLTISRPPSASQSAGRAPGRRTGSATSR